MVWHSAGSKLRPQDSVSGSEWHQRRAMFRRSRNWAGRQLFLRRSLSTPGMHQTGRVQENKLDAVHESERWTERRIQASLPGRRLGSVLQNLPDVANLDRAIADGSVIRRLLTHAPGNGAPFVVLAEFTGSARTTRARGDIIPRVRVSRVGDAVHGVVTDEVPAGSTVARPVGAVVEVEHRGPKIRQRSDVFVAEHGEVAAAARGPSHGSKAERLVGEAGGFGCGCGSLGEQAEAPTSPVPGQSPMKLFFRLSGWTSRSSADASRRSRPHARP